MVPVWRLVNDWFTGGFFPLDVVDCFIGFVATISWPAALRAPRAENLL
jgi:hypothetical protein